jgi:8-oxo-dGTP pyrophosphatase MutT (NUDIX family)
MRVVYAQDALPASIEKSIFLAGPTPRDKTTQSWRHGALKILELLGYDGVVFVPEYRTDQDHSCNYEWDGQVQWEHDALNMSDCIVFWVPREMTKMPAFTTNDEWGTWKESGKVVFGAPPRAVKVRYQRHYADLYQTPHSDTLAGTLESAVDRVAKGALRTHGECQVPLMIWNTPQFTSWYAQQKANGNYLGGAQMLWNFRVGPKKDIVFAFAMRVNVYVESEGRWKSNEFIFSRTDISSVVLYRRAEKFEDSEVVLVKEFRSPVRNELGFVYENPGGSSHKAADPAKVASDEVFEETGMRIAPGRFQFYKSRQAAATLSTHHVFMYAAELTEEEMTKAKETAKSGKMFGNNVTDSEQTYLHVATVKDLLGSQLPVDWSMFGMIMRALL